MSPDTQTVPDAFGKVQVLSAPVMSREVRIPLKELSPPVDGLSCRVSEFAVDDIKVAALIVVKVAENTPEDWV